jgi:uncharacterized protein
MTPQEQKLVDQLFDRLATLEGRKRDPEAERVIAEGLERAPNAVYSLVQTVLVQDEALRNVDARIRELDGGGTESGFLDNMRYALFGGVEKPRGSVPPVRPEGTPMGVPPGFRTGAAQSDPSATDRQDQTQGGTQRGGSFLGTAAAAAAGVIGGALLLDGIRSMMGSRPGADTATASHFGDNAGKSPWDSKDSGSELSREAGVDDVGHGNRDRADAQDQRAYDTAQADVESDDAGLDFDIGGDSDFA